MRRLPIVLLAGLVASCGPSLLLTDLKAKVESAHAPDKPTITPPGGSYRVWPGVTVTTATDGARLYYSTDGTAPLFNQFGSAQLPTLRIDSSTFTLAPGTLGNNRYTFRVNAWKNGQRSEEATAVFAVSGAGGVAWDANANGTAVATAIADDGSRYSGGASNGNGSLTRWTADGKALWTVSVDGAGTTTAEVTGVAVLAGTGVYVVGNLKKPGVYTIRDKRSAGAFVTLDTSATPPLAYAGAQGSAGFLALFTPSGVLQGAMYVKSSMANSAFNGLAADAVSSRLYLAADVFQFGSTDNTPTEIVNGSGTVMSNAPSGIDPGRVGRTGYLLKVDGSGTIEGWAGNTVSTGDTSVTSVAVDPVAAGGLVVAGGWFVTEADFGTGSLSAPPGFQFPFVLGTDLATNPLWATQGSTVVGGETPAQLYAAVNAVAITPSALVLAGGVSAPAGSTWVWGSSTNVYGSAAGGSGYFVLLDSTGGDLASASVQSAQPSAVRGLATNPGSTSPVTPYPPFFYIVGDHGSGAFVLKVEPGGTTYQPPNSNGVAARNPFLMSVNQSLTAVNWFGTPGYGSGAGGAASIAHAPGDPYLVPGTPDRLLVGGAQDTATPLQLGPIGSSGKSAGALVLELFD